MRAWPLAVLVACSACAQSKTEQAGGHRYAVADGHAVTEGDWPFFLPRSEEDGFTFVLNPKAALPHQILVGVDTKANVCRRAAGTKAYVNSTVCTASPLRWRDQELLRSGDETLWTYALNGPPAAPSKGRAILISCSQISGPAKGLCMAPLPFGDLVITLHLQDAEVHRLGIDYDAATALLRSWER